MVKVCVVQNLVHKLSGFGNQVTCWFRLRLAKWLLTCGLLNRTGEYQAQEAAPSSLILVDLFQIYRIALSSISDNYFT